MKKKGLVVGIIIILFVLTNVVSCIRSDATISPIMYNDGNLSGYVKDNLMTPVDGVRVRVYFHGTYEEDYTDSSGYYHVTNIPICYCMKNATASKAGYITEWVLLSIDEDTTYDFVLTPLAGNILYVGGSGPNNYSSIQDAIDNTNNGDTVFVYNGIYFENIHITEKAINLIGENKDNTIVDCQGSGDALFIFMPAGEINIGGFTFQNSGTSGAGIFIDYGLDYVCKKPVSANQKTNNYDEILINIYNNILTNNGVGIWFFWWTYNVHIFMNNIISNTDGITVNPSSSYNSVSQNNILDSNCGIALLNSEYTDIYGNVIANNDVGLDLMGSSNNNIIANSISYNDEYGIQVRESSAFNTFYHNNLINNTMNAYDQCYNNTWDNGYPSGGNYWSDYDGSDDYNGPNQDIPGSDGIGDTPYDLPCEHSTDFYPLMEPWSGINLPPFGPMITGSTEGRIGESYEYTFITADPENEDVYYWIEWGDDSVEEWIGPYGSGEEVVVSHTWNRRGTYLIKARAKDTNNLWGPWSILEVTMPMNQHPFYSMFIRFLERFPNAFPVLRYIL